MAARNRALYGVDTPAEVIDKYRPGGGIYFDARRGPDNVQNPRQIATLSNGLQAAVFTDDLSQREAMLTPPGDVGLIAEGAYHQDTGALLGIGQLAGEDRHFDAK